MTPSPLQRLEAWVQAELLTREQAAAIIAFEEKEGTQTPTSRWLSFAFMAMGGVILGLGVISLIAANWSAIPDWAKLAADFTLLTALGLWGWLQLESDACCRRELPLLLFVLLCLASIGLIGQIYHLEGPWHTTILFWCALTLPVITYSRRMVLPTLWSGGFLSGILFWYDRFWLGTHATPDLWMVATLVPLPLFCLLLARLLPLLPRLQLLAKGFRIWFGFSALMGVAALEIHAYTSTSAPRVEALYPALLLALLLVMSFRGTRGRLGAVQGLILLLYLAMAYIILILDLPEWIAAPLTFALASLGAIHAAMNKEFLIARNLVLLAGMRAYLVFLEVFGSLATTGVGMIFFGGLLLALVYLWQRHQVRLQRWLEGLAP